jgi:hypothetical protein
MEIIAPEDVKVRYMELLQKIVSNIEAGTSEN